MRLKKLRLLVGITMILFIFIAGSIIVLGKLGENNSGVQSDKQAQSILLVDPRQIAQKEIQTETNVIKLGEEDKNTPPTKPIEDPKPKVVEPAPIPPEPVVVHHHRRRTRAS